jgi:hypothetical protein
MRYHVQPEVKQLGITKRVSWHTYATLLKANGEDVKSSAGIYCVMVRHA